MRVLKHMRSWGLQSSTRKFGRHRKINHQLVTEDQRPLEKSSVAIRSLSTSLRRPAKPMQLLQNDNGLEKLDVVRAHLESSSSLPYLEAYDLMEENADVIFDHEKMIKERTFMNDDTTTIQDASAAPLPASRIPGPKSWPVVGCLPFMMRHKDFDPKRTYIFWRAVKEEFGPIFRKDMPGHPYLLFITNPADVQAMYQTTMYNPVRPGMQSLKKIREPGGADGKSNTYCEIFNGKAGILAEQKEEWWRVRRQVQRPVTNINIVGRYLPKMNDVAEAFIDRIRVIRDEKNEMPETFNKEMYKWALESLGTIALERRLGCLDPELNDSSRPVHLVRLVEQLLETLHETENIKLWQYFPTSSIKRLQEAHDVFTGVALEAIKDTEKLIESKRPLSGKPKADVSSASPSSCPVHSRNLESHEESSLLEMLLKLPGLSKSDVLTFLIDMLATGIDTTSHTAGNMLYLLARNPKEQERLRKEIQRVIPDPRHITPEQIGSLTYAKAVFRETLRVMPVNVGVTRKLVQDTVLSGYLIPKGWQVVMPTMLMNVQEDIFPRASEFLPERFLRGSPYAPKHHFAFLPFSFGPRMCVGRRIAYQEIICLVVRILNEFEVEYHHEDVELVNRLAYGPSCPLKFTFIDRR